MSEKDRVAKCERVDTVFTRLKEKPEGGLRGGGEGGGDSGGVGGGGGWGGGGGGEAGWRIRSPDVKLSPERARTYVGAGIEKKRVWR